MLLIGFNSINRASNSSLQGRNSAPLLFHRILRENEWKSHPYFTKQIIYSLPIREYEDSELDKQIIKVATELAHKYEYVKDVQLEKLVMKKYGCLILLIQIVPPGIL